MKFPDWLIVFGDPEYRGDCPAEGAEQIAFFSGLRSQYPHIAEIALHPKNEGKRRGNDFMILALDKAKGFATGASDIVIPGSPAFVCELKRRDHTKSSWQAGQQEYLQSCRAMGAFVCVALGHEAALEAVTRWQKMSEDMFAVLSGHQP